MVRTQLYLPQELFQRISQKAKREGKPKAEIIRAALETGLKTDSKEEYRKKLLNIKGDWFDIDEYNEMRKQVDERKDPYESTS